MRRHKRRIEHSVAKRKQIIELAKRNRWTAKQVCKRYGIAPVTWYSWRRKYGLIVHHPKNVSALIRRLVIAHVKREVPVAIRSMLQNAVPR